jgi:hypothetical protein
MTFNKTLIALALASTLGACGSDKSDSPDTTAPDITLSGADNVTINLNEAYTDAGATANDAVDGTVQVTTTGAVDTATAGDYTLTFTATDAAGNESTTTRTVTVLAPVQTTISGQAVKGVLANATVTVYKFDDNGNPVALDPETELEDGEITTDGSGNYSFVVLNYEGPIKVELSPSTDPANPTTMICDAPAGCGDTAFGTTIDLTAADPTFKLAAISVVDTESAGEVKVNVSALTHLATELIEADGDGITAESVTEQSEKIASTFGIEGDITQLEATVTTDAAAVAGEDNDAELRLGLINAGIMSAIFSGETDDNGILSAKLAEVANDLVANDGAILVNQDDADDGFELAVSDVLEGAGAAASAAVELIEADDTLTDTTDIIDELDQEETNLANEQAYQEANVGEDGLSEVVVDAPTAGDAVAKAKAMVNDVRLFSHLFDGETTEGAGIAGQGDAYVALMEAAGDMVAAEAESFNLLAQVSDALAELSLRYDTPELTAETSAAGVDVSTLIQGATGLIVFNEKTTTGGVLFTVTATSGSEIVNLDASAEFSDDGKSIIVNLEGSVESAGAKFMLAEGSFAQINFDSVASRDAFDNDTFEGEIVSGELNLDVTLAQKTSEAVANPVTFTGMLQTNLSQTGERVLSEYKDQNAETGETTFSYGRSEIETKIIPEMVNLSGEFSSSEGDLIGATLTVNVNGLDKHQAPDFKYLGKEIANLLNISVSGDKNTIVITHADSVADYQRSTETRTFTLGQQTGEWTATSSIVAANAEEHSWGTGIERKIVTKRFETELSEQGILYSRVFVTGEEENNFGFKSIRITPVDNDGDNTTDGYKFERISQYDGKDYDGTNVETLVDASGNILLSDGTIHPWDSSADLGVYSSIDNFISNNSHQLIANPYTVSNGTELLAQTISNWWGSDVGLDVDDKGIAYAFFNEEELAVIAAGEFTELNPIAYLTQPIVKDALTIEVSADSNTVTSTLGDYTREVTFAFTGEGDSFGNYESSGIVTGPNYSEEKEVRSETTNEDNGLDYPTVVLRVSKNQIYHEDDQHKSAVQFEVTPNDIDDDGVTDHVTVIQANGTHFNDNDVLIDYDGNEAEFYYMGTYSYDTDSQFAHITQLFSSNPLTNSNALELAKANIESEDRTKGAFAEGIGQLEVTLSEEELELIVADSTTMFDAIVTKADSRTSLEDENNFLGVNAALTLEAMLGDYQVKVQLSGDRSSLENGTFDLDMNYRLPGATEQRSFTIQYDTEVEGRLTANNTDGVVLVLNEPDEDADGTQILGQILVGPSATVAATIEDRDGLVVIVYSDETTESL